MSIIGARSMRFEKLLQLKDSEQEAKEEDNISAKVPNPKQPKELINNKFCGAKITSQGRKDVC
jgi:hypothetical protein